jgi:hypothetical protein
VDPAAGVSPAACLAAAGRRRGRQSRHARTVALPAARAFVKVYPAPGERRARRAATMAAALTAAGFGAPRTLVLGWREGAGLLVMRDVGGEPLLDALARLAAAGPAARAAKRTLLRALGAEIGRLHAAGFVHGDLVPPNVHARDGRFVLLDNDRTRRGRVLVRLGGRRNLVQLGRFVAPGVTLTDRCRVLAAYAAARGLDRRARRRLAWWLVAKTTARRCAIDDIAVDAARAAGFRALMRSGGPFDAARTA